MNLFVFVCSGLRVTPASELPIGQVDSVSPHVCSLVSFHFAGRSLYMFGPCKGWND